MRLHFFSLIELYLFLLLPCLKENGRQSRDITCLVHSDESWVGLGLCELLSLAWSIRHRRVREHYGDSGHAFTAFYLYLSAITLWNVLLHTSRVLCASTIVHGAQLAFWHFKSSFRELPWEACWCRGCQVVLWLDNWYRPRFTTDPARQDCSLNVSVLAVLHVTRPVSSLGIAHCGTWFIVSMALLLLSPATAVHLFPV